MALRTGFAFTSMTIGPQAAVAILAAYVSAALALEAVVADPGAVGATIGQANAAAVVLRQPSTRPVCAPCRGRFRRLMQPRQVGALVVARGSLIGAWSGLPHTLS